MRTTEIELSWLTVTVALSEALLPLELVHVIVKVVVWKRTGVCSESFKFRLPLQGPAEAKQETALLETQDKLERLPEVTELGFALRSTTGSFSAPTLTTTLSESLPAELLQVIVKVREEVMAPVLWLLFRFLAPGQLDVPPLAVQVVAFWLVHDRLAEVLYAMLMGQSELLALMSTAGRETCDWTTIFLRQASPKRPKLTWFMLQSKLYVPGVEGATKVALKLT